MAKRKSMRGQSNLLLRKAREERGWTQQELAELVEAPYPFMINRWENGVVSPSPVYRARLAKLFGQSAGELGLLPSQKAQSASSVKLYDSMIPLPFANERALIGRADLLAQLGKLFYEQQGQARAALIGLPGVGKTTLAAALANEPVLQDHFDDGILWLGLGPQPNLTALLSRWGSLLGINQNEAASLRDQQSWLAWLHQAIGARRMLLIIDDAWTIEEAQTCQVGGPNCSYLLTTRLQDVALQFADTHVMRVPELSQVESLKLLLQLAPVIAQAEMEIVQKLIQATGGLPLALTLLGQHLLVRTNQQTSRRLQATLAQLQNFEERMRLQQPQAGLLRDFRLPAGSTLSLQAIIGLSEAELSAGTRQMLSALAVLPAKPGSFAEEAALAVSQGQVEDLDLLVDASLVEYIGEDRYSLHQTIADYARARSRDVAAEKRMASYFSTLLIQHGSDFCWLEQEMANLLQALQFALEHDLQTVFIQGALAFVPFLQNRAQHQLVEHYLKQAQHFARVSGLAETLITVLRTCGNVALWLGNYEEGEAIYQEGLLLAQHEEIPAQICQFLLSLGRLVGRRGDYTRAERYFQEGLPLARQLADREAACHLLLGLGTLAGERGEYDQAEIHFNESLLLARQLEAPEPICKSLSNLAVIAAEQAHFEEAERYWQEVLPLVRQMQWTHQLSITLFNLGSLMRDQGNFARAQSYYEECLTLDRQLADPERLCQTLVEFSTLLRKRRMHERASIHVQEGLKLAEQMGHRRLLGELWLETGELALLAAQLERAEHAFNVALERMPEGQHSLEVGTHYGLARVAAARGNIDEARRLGQKCLASYIVSGYQRQEEVRAWLETLA